tara:strand:- start:10275 stop:12152 length:1878 start_codon:yes stop_codon:yes gene_type:complete
VKKPLIVFIALISFTTLSAQNLVPNASFEEFDSTFVLPGPYYLNQSFGIYDYWNSIYTADFYYIDNYWIFDSMPEGLFDSLSTNVYLGADSCFLCAPYNNFGYRTPRTGNGYTGIRAYSGALGHNYKEFIKVELNEPLIEGKLYQISFYTCPSTQNPFALNSLGAYITTNEVNDYNNLPAQVLSEDTISDTSEWTEVKGLYRANGDENHITIGNFDTETEFNDPFFNVRLSCLYYFLEDVSFFPYSNITDTTMCEGDTLILSPKRQDNVTCLWQDGSTDTLFYAYEEGTYWMKQSYYWQETSTTVNHYDTIHVSFKSLDDLLPTDLGNDTSICPGENLIFTATNSNVNYQWSNGANTNQFTTNQSGMVWLKEYNECEMIADSIKISHIEKLFLELGSDTIMCYNDSHTLQVKCPNVNILWNDGSTNNNYEVNNEGLYYVTISNQCESISDSIRFSHYPRLNLNLGEDVLLCKDDTINFEMNTNVSNENAHYLWQDGSQNPSYTFKDLGEYWVKISSNCETLIDSLVIRYFCECEVFIPNSFTPNHDQHNDYFLTKQNCGYDSFHLQIFNRWGELIFETYNPKEYWDGKYKGKMCPIGVYTYKLILQFEEGYKKIKRKTGTILLAQ